MAKLEMAKADIRVPEVLPAITDAVLVPAAVTEDAGRVVGFVDQLRQFWAHVTALEETAVAFETAASQRVPPTSRIEDAALVTEIKTAMDDRDRYLGEWGISTVLHRLHKAATAKRGIGESAYKRGLAALNGCHQAWERAEHERIHRERQRQQREHDARERAAKAEIEARLEAARQEAEDAASDLSERERGFVQLVWNGTDKVVAARLVGYKDPEARATIVMASPKVKAALKALGEEASAKHQAAREQQELAATAYASVAAAEVAQASAVTISGEVIDAAAFVAAVLDPATRERLMIPCDVLTVAQGKLTEAVRRLPRSIVDQWPGIQVKDTKGVRR